MRIRQQRFHRIVTAALGSFFMLFAFVACAPEEIGGISGSASGGGSAAGGTTSKETASELDDTPAEGDNEAAENEHEPAAETKEPQEPEHNAGNIRVVLEQAGVQRYFHYTASHCIIRDDYIMAEGVGTEEGGGPESTVAIFTHPEELYHVARGIWQGSGLIHFTADGKDIISDARPVQYTPTTNPIPSVLTYQIQENSVLYIVEWWHGPVSVGAGEVKMTCNYD